MAAATAGGSTKPILAFVAETVERRILDDAFFRETGLVL